MSRTSTLPRDLAALLLGAVVLPGAPALSQNIERLPSPVPGAPSQSPPPPTPSTVLSAPTPQIAPVIVAPPPASSIPPAASPTSPPDAEVAEQPSAATRPALRARAPRTEAIRAPAEAAGVEPAPPPATAPEPVGPPVLAAPEPTPETEPVATEDAEQPAGSIWPWALAGAALLFGFFGLLAWRRRRVDEYEYVEEQTPARPSPTMPAEPAAPLAAPKALRVEAPRPAAPPEPRPFGGIAGGQSYSLSAPVLVGFARPSPKPVVRVGHGAPADGSAATPRLSGN